MEIYKGKDQLWKGILDELFDDFLRFFIADADEIFDFSRKIDFLDKELPQIYPSHSGVPGLRIVDKLAKIYLKGTDDKWILVHVEVQAQKGNEDFAARMFRYFYRALDKHNVSISAFAILIDNATNFKPAVYSDEYLGTSLRYEFNVLKLLEQKEDQLLANPNPFALVILIALKASKHKKLTDTEILEMKIHLTKELFKRTEDKNKQKSILNFINYYINFSNTKMIDIFEKEVQILTGETNIMGMDEALREMFKEQGLEEGLQEGRKKGLREGRREGIKKGRLEQAQTIAMELQKLGMPIVQIRKITKLPAKTIQAMLV